MKTRILVVILCLACTASFAQNRRKKKPLAKPKATTQQPSTALNNNGTSAAPDTTKKVVAAKPPLKPFDRPLDGYYKKTNILSAKITPYPNLREVDVAFAKRIWREIDVREKMNQYLNSPKQRLIDVLLNAINSGELTAYDANPDPKIDPDGDAFTRPLSAGEAYSKLADSSLVEKRDANNNVISSKMVAGDFNRDSLVKFRIKEDWIFDKQRSQFEPRIIGIAPMMKIKGAGAVGDYQPAFWIYFPDARQVLATKEVASRDNDNTGLSFDDVFMKRIFTSYIVKESNDKNDRIRDNFAGIDRLYESERIKKALMDWEINLWQY
jgi:gliding motility associated protien GldN